MTKGKIAQKRLGTRKSARVKNQQKLKWASKTTKNNSPTVERLSRSDERKKDTLEDTTSYKDSNDKKDKDVDKKGTISTDMGKKHLVGYKTSPRDQ